MQPSLCFNGSLPVEGDSKNCVRKKQHEGKVEEKAEMRKTSIFNIRWGPETEITVVYPPFQR